MVLKLLKRLKLAALKTSSQQLLSIALARSTLVWSMIISTGSMAVKINYPHPVCEPILNMTYGVIVYQEQVMRIAVDLSGFTLGGADKLRKAMGKKEADVMEKLGKQFVDGAYEKSGMPKEAAHELFENIKKFAGYAFNKSHSAAYPLSPIRQHA